jgi:DNA polymerase I
VLARHGVTLRGVAFDTMLASYLLDATRSGHPLEDSALEHLGYKALSEEDVCGRGAKATALRGPAGGGDARLRRRARGPGAAAGADARAAARDERGRSSVYRDARAAARAGAGRDRAAGVRVDGPALAAQSQHVERELATRSARIFELAGGEFNINSPKQLGEVLFEKLQLPALKRTGKTRAASTAADVLEELALTHELPRLILEWRALQKLKGTYIDALPQLVHPRPAASTPASTRRSPRRGA